MLGLAILLLGAACQKKPATTTNANAAVTNSAAANVANVNGATPPATPTSTMDPCTLITKAEAEAVFERPAAEPELKGTACHYDTADKTKFFDLTSKAGTSADFETMKNLCDSSTQPVSGLGDSSCTANNTVVVLKNNVLMTLIAGGVFSQGQLRSLAVIAVSRLP